MRSDLQPRTMIKGGVAAWTGRGILALILGLYVFYAWYLARTLPAFPMEMAYEGGQGSLLFSTIRRFWVSAFGESLGAARSLSVFSAVAALGLAYRIGVTLTGDQTVGAFLASGFVLFPPLVGLFSLATPHALATFFSLCAALLCVKPMGQIARRWRVVGAVLFLAAAVITGLDGVPEDHLGGPNQDTILTSLVLPYAMLWTGGLLGVAALVSPKVRGRLGRRVWVVHGALVVTVVFFAAVFLLFDIPADRLLGVPGYVFGICVLAVLPLIVSVRFVMPEVRAIVAWLAFPVIMYSGFWVVLGPVDRESFPYNWIGAESAEGPVAFVRFAALTLPSIFTYPVDYK